MVFGLDPKIFEDRVRPESFHMILPAHMSALAREYKEGTSANRQPTQFSIWPCRMG